jgi:uncharacterized RDD family membrane protein YckC
MNETPQQPAQRYAPPTAAVADVSDGGVALAGRGTRLAAAIIDGSILLALLWLAGKVTPWNVFDEGMADAGFLKLVGMQVMAIALYMLVNGWLLASRGQTVGKLALGLRIVRSDGSQADALRLIGVRYALCWLAAAIPFAGNIFSLVDALAIFRESRQCLHDTIADTIVVKASSGS